MKNKKDRDPYPTAGPLPAFTKCISEAKDNPRGVNW